jgi:hypothetical protein
MKQKLEMLTKELVHEFCEVNNVRYSHDLYQEATHTIVYGPEADSEWDEPWVHNWLKEKRPASN